MGECRHCSGSGRCQDDYHSGAGLFGGTDDAGQNHPGLLGGLLGDCPRCGGSNTEWRPECRHCQGSGRDQSEWFPFGAPKKTYLGGESVKERMHREGTSNGGGSTSSGFGGGESSITDKAAMIGGAIGAFCGLLTALESAESVAGYIFYIVVGFFGGAILTSLLIAALPWAILAGILILLIKACGG